MGTFVEYPCPNCNAELNYDADAAALLCSHCRTKIAIEQSIESVNENNLDGFLKSAAHQLKQPVSVLVFRCSNCGKENNIPENEPITECAHCGTNAVNPQAYEKEIFHPKGLLPFEISKNEVADVYSSWIGKGWFSPDKLKKENILDKLEGVYLPFWTFDAQTHAEWSGEGGEYYYETEFYTGSNGKQQSRQVQHTRWYDRSGDVDGFYDDILICGSTKISQKECAKIFPFKLQKIVPFDYKFLLGWKETHAEKSTEECIALSKDIIENAVYNACAAECKIDTYRNLDVDVTYSSETYKHVLLPIWFCDYWYNGKKYHFMVNGQTGSIDGTKPVSAGKVTLAVILFILVVAVIYYLSESGSR